MHGVPHTNFTERVDRDPPYEADPVPMQKERPDPHLPLLLGLSGGFVIGFFMGVGYERVRNSPEWPTFPSKQRDNESHP
jgi:hypothetical protein